MPQLHTHRAQSKLPSSHGKSLHANQAPLPTAPIRVALATLVDAAPEGPGWVHEVKLDGYRMLCRIEHGGARLVTRNSKDWTARAPAVVRAAATLSVDTAILDGELVYLQPNGITDFQALQNALRDGKSDMLRYFAFDLLFMNGLDLRGLPLLERKARLSELLLANAPGAPTSPMLRLSEHIVGQGDALFRSACKLGLEGIISKRADSAYRAGRGRDWLKIKCMARQEMVIVGYTKPRGSRRHLGALLVAMRENGTLCYAGKVGTGFSQRSLGDLHRILRAHQRGTPACEKAPRGRAGRAATWVEPLFVAEVEFSEITNDGIMRHPTFRGLREDKPASEVVRERRQALNSVGSPGVPRAKSRRVPG